MSDDRLEPAFEASTPLSHVQGLAKETGDCKASLGVEANESDVVVRAGSGLALGNAKKPKDSGRRF